MRRQWGARRISSVKGNGEEERGAWCGVRSCQAPAAAGELPHWLRWRMNGQLARHSARGQLAAAPSCPCSVLTAATLLFYLSSASVLPLSLSPPSLPFLPFLPFLVFLFSLWKKAHNDSVFLWKHLCLDRVKNNRKIKKMRILNKNSDFYVDARIVKNDVILNNKNII
jgi:hypothetical protein